MQLDDSAEDQLAKSQRNASGGREDQPDAIPGEMIIYMLGCYAQLPADR